MAFAKFSVDLGRIRQIVFRSDKGYFAMIAAAPILDTYLDESADENRRLVFVVGAFLASEPNWKAIQDAWLKRLKDDEVLYFSAKHCNSVTGPFKHLRAKYK